MYFNNNCALQTCSIFKECVPKHEAACEMKCLSKNKDNATLQWASSRAYVLFSSWSCNNQCNPMQLIHPSARAHDRHFLRFSSHLLYILPSVRLSLRGEYFAIVLEVCWFRNCFYELKTAVLDKQFAHAPQWISIGIAHCIVSQPASKPANKMQVKFVSFYFCVPNECSVPLLCSIYSCIRVYNHICRQRKWI